MVESGEYSRALAIRFLSLISMWSSGISVEGAKNATPDWVKNHTNGRTKTSSRNWAFLVGNLFPHPVGVFCTLLEAPSSHIAQIVFFALFL